MTVALTELDDAQIKRFKGFVCYHHLVPVSKGGENSVGNLRPFIFSSHVLIHIVLAAYWPNKPNLQYAVDLMTTGESRKDALTSFPEEVLAAMDSAVTKSNAERSRTQALLASTGDHNFQDRTQGWHATPGLPRCTKCFGQHRVLTDRTKGQKALKKEIKCETGTSKHQLALDHNNPPFCTLGKYNSYWICWCSHLRDGIPCRGHITATAYAASKA